jgi:phage/plasmid primase-like uncharacterized protein
MECADCANHHDAGKQIARTRQIWRSRLGRDLSDEDARQTIHNVTGFFGVLAEWARAEKIAATEKDNASPREPRRAMTAECIAKALGGRRVGATWMARCPAHEDRKPSLSISAGRDGKVLVRCHAGCDQRDVIAILRQRSLWETTWKSRSRFTRKRQDRVSDEPDADDLKRSEAAQAIWHMSQSPEGTLVAAYLRSRGLVLPASTDLRFHPGLKHPSGGIWPAMVALVTDGMDGAPRAIHRTFIARDGAAKAPVNPAKMMLGPCRGGMVRLAHPGAFLMIGEGIETCLSAMQATGYPAWAALSTSGLRTLNLPPAVRDVIVLADGDEAGEAAARDCALRWKREGRRTRIARPPKGTDFNDLLVAFRSGIAFAETAKVSASGETASAALSYGRDLPWR